VGLRHVVEQTLAPVEQEADEQAVALVGWKTPQGMSLLSDDGPLC
jgi:hypothetical protein